MFTHHICLQIFYNESGHTATTVVDSSGQQVAEFSKMTAAADVVFPSGTWGIMLNPFQRSI